MNREHLFAAFFFVVLIFLLYQVYRVFAPFLAPVAWAAILALVFYPLYRTVLVRMPNANAASLLTTAIVYLIVVLPAMGISGVVVTQARDFYSFLQDQMQSGELARWAESVRQSRLVQLAMAALPQQLRAGLGGPGAALEGAQAATQYLVLSLGGVALNVFNFLMDFLITMFTLFFFFRDGQAMYRGFRQLLPMERQHKDVIFRRLYDTLSAVVQGMMATALVQGVLCGVAFWALDVPFSLLLGFAAALASFVPFFGAGLVWLPCVAYLMVTGLWVRSVLLLAWGSLAVSTVDNLLRPMIIGDRTKIPTIFLFFGILGGVQAYGVIGVFLGPALIGMLVAVLRIYRDEYAAGRA